MDKEITIKIIKICEQKILKNGELVGLSFYAFFENKNSNPELLFEIAKWWILDMRFDHFEKATKILKVLKEKE